MPIIDKNGKFYSDKEYIKKLLEENKRLLQRLHLSKRDNRTNRDRLRKDIVRLENVIINRDDDLIKLIEKLKSRKTLWEIGRTLRRW